MAFPVVSSLTTTTFSTGATAHLVAMPATVNAGDLLIAMFVNNTADTVTTPSGWTQLHTTAGGASALQAGAYYKIAAGTEGGTTVDWVTAGSRKAVAHVYRITSWHGTTPPEIGTPVATATTTTPDPPSLTPSWGALDTLWLPFVGSSVAASVSSGPTDYTDLTTTATSASAACAVSSARRELNASSDDPGVFTGTSSRWVTSTIGVRPSAGGSALVTPTVIAEAVTLPTPTILAAATLAPAVIPIVASLPTPLIAAAATVTPAAIAVVATLPTPTVSVGAVTSPAVIAVVTTLPTPNVLAASKVTPAVIPLVVTLPTPLAGAPTIVTPAAVAVTAALPTPSILAGAKVLPAVIPLAALLPTPTATDSASAVVTPAVIAAIVGLPTPSATTDAVVTPAGIALVVTVPTPGVTTPGLVTPAGVSLVVTLPTPLATVGAITFWTPNPVAFVPVGPGDEPPWN